MGAEEQQLGAGQGGAGEAGFGDPAPDPGQAQPKLKRKKHAKAAPPGGAGAALPGETGGGGSTDKVMALLGALPLRTPDLRGLVGGWIFCCCLGVTCEGWKETYTLLLAWTLCEHDIPHKAGFLQWC